MLYMQQFVINYLNINYLTFTYIYQQYEIVIKHV
jgi:hypothetical protein